MSCETLTPPPAPFRFVLPGGTELVGFDLASLAQPALAPLGPFFRLLDVVVKTVDVVRAIPDALTMPPDPTAVIARLPALFDALAQLGVVVPQVSVPLTAVGILDGVIEELGQTRQRLAALDVQAQRITRARDRAAALLDGSLLASAVCAERDLATAVELVMAPLASIEGLLGILALLLGVAGGPSLPPWNLATGGDRAELVRQLESLEQELVAIRGSLPVP